MYHMVQVGEKRDEECIEEDVVVETKKENVCLKCNRTFYNKYKLRNHEKNVMVYIQDNVEYV